MGWVKKGLVYSPKNKHGWDSSHATMPVILKTDASWRIYFSTRDSNTRSHPTFIDVEPGNPCNVLYEHDRPILKIGDLGSFDEYGIMPSSLVKSKSGDFYMYYVGWSVKQSVPFDNHTGLAVSKDGGKTFSKIGPVLGKSIEDPYFTGTCTVIIDMDMYRAYYMSGIGWSGKGVNPERPEPMYNLRYAHSLDGINWSRRSIPVVDLKGDEAGICQASVIKHGDKSYGIWYSYRNMGSYRTEFADGYRIGYAESSDGVTWIRRDDHRGLLTSEYGWDSGMTCCPCVFLHDGRLWMFYNGSSFGRDGFGYAIWEGSIADDFLNSSL